MPYADTAIHHLNTESSILPKIEKKIDKKQ